MRRIKSALLPTSWRKSTPTYTVGISKRVCRKPYFVVWLKTVNDVQTHVTITMDAFEAIRMYKNLLYVLNAPVSMLVPSL